MRILPVASVVAGLLLVLACGDDDAPATASSSSSSSTSSSASSGSSASSSSSSSSSTSTSSSTGGPAAFTVTSTAYTEGQPIPAKYKCATDNGENKSIPITWTGAPAETKSFAVVMRDLDFNNGFVHWTIWNIPVGATPAAATSLPEGVEGKAKPAVPKGAIQAKFNDAIVGYQGPCSPTKVNTYEITVYAIPTETIAGIDAGTVKTDVQKKIVEVAIASAKLSGES